MAKLGVISKIHRPNEIAIEKKSGIKH